MKNRTKMNRLAPWLALALMAVTAAAGEPTVPNPEPPKPLTPPAETTPPEVAPIPEGPRDPFADPPGVRRRRDRRDAGSVSGQGTNPLNGGKAATAGDVVQPAQIETISAPSLPRLTLVGCVQKRGDKAVALLQIDDREFFVIRAGDTVNVKQNNLITMLKVKALNGLSAEIEVPGDLPNERKVISVR